MLVLILKQDTFFSAVPIVLEGKTPVDYLKDEDKLHDPQPIDNHRNQSRNFVSLNLFVAVTISFSNQAASVFLQTCI